MPHQDQSRQAKIQKSGSIKIVTVGTSGTDISGHRFFEEYLDALVQTDAPDIWDEMRRSDDQIKMLLRVVKNPIMSARWFIAPADDEDESKKIADFMTHVLFDDMGTEEHPKTFEKFKREALTSVEFGYSLFEITNKIVLNDPEFGSYVGLKGLDWRSPKTIEEWYVTKSGELEQVRQTDNSERAQDVFILGAFLLHIAPEMEGDNYEGISMLRPIYGNWLRKDIMRKLQMIGIERGATGVPIGVIPQGQINSSSQAALEDSLSHLVAHERQYMTVPEGFNIDSLKIEHDAEKVQSAIEAENVGMAKSFLANFMELGLNGTGSYALGTDLSDIFLSGIEVYADAIISPINSKLIPMLVKLNFGLQRKYPKLKIEGINDKAGKEFAEVLQLLKQNDLIQVTDQLKEIVHKKFKLPDFDKDFIEPEPEKPPDDEGEKSSAAVDSGDNANQKLDPANKLTEIIYSLAAPNVGRNIEKVGTEMTGIMSKNMRTRGNNLVDQMMSVWRNAPRSQRMKRVNMLSVPGRNEYKRLIADNLADVYVGATAGVKKELTTDGLKLAEKSEIKDLPAESKATGASQADLIVESQDADLRKNLFFSFTSKADVLPTEAQMNANLLNVVEQYAEGASIRVAGPNAVANAVNLARNAVFQKKKTLDKIESFIFTNPSPDAPICVHLTGRVFTKAEYVVSDKLPPLHHNCNSWIQAQVAGRPGNKSVSPAGLTVQGTAKQIETIEKSATFLAVPLIKIEPRKVAKKVVKPSKPVQKPVPVDDFADLSKKSVFVVNKVFESPNKNIPKSVLDYVEGSDDVNNALRQAEKTGRKSVLARYSDQIKGLDEALNIKTLKAPIQLNRGIVFETKKEFDSFLESRAVGTIHENSAYTSTTTAEILPGFIKGNYPIKIKILANEETKGVYLTKYKKFPKSLKGEQEFLLPRKTKFKILSRKKIADFSERITMQAINE